MQYRVSAREMWAAIANRAGVFFVIGLAALLTGLSLAAALGLAPWLLGTDGPAPLGLSNGILVQLAFTGLALAMTSFLPASHRVAQLERTHRDFRVTMSDVAEAYAFCHASDRAGLFNLQSEFDSVRERITHLRDHPQLSDLQPEVMDLAAQMSHVSRDLAQTYSDDKVAHARGFLTQRLTEIAQFEQRIAQATQLNTEMRAAATRLQQSEHEVQADLERLEAELQETLAPLGYDLARPAHKVVALQR